MFESRYVCALLPTDGQMKNFKRNTLDFERGRFRGERVSKDQGRRNDVSSKLLER